MMRSASQLNAPGPHPASVPQRLFNAYVDAIATEPTSRLYLRGTAWHITATAALWRAALASFPEYSPRETQPGNEDLVELIRSGGSGVPAVVGAHEGDPWPNAVYSRADALLSRSAELTVLLTYFGSAGLATLDEVASLVREVLAKHPAASLLLIAGDRAERRVTTAADRQSYRAVMFYPQTERRDLLRLFVENKART